MFWETQCPARGTALTHAHSTKCEDDHAKDQCCHCLQRAGGTEVPEHSHVWNVGGRCTVCAIRLNSDGTPAAETYPDFVARTLIEPRAVTGRGPVGPLWGPGRGILTERQEKRLSFVAWLVEHAAH